MQKEMNSQNLQSNDLPQTGLIRLRQVLLFIPVSASTWWAGVKGFRFPKPVHLSKRVTAWKIEDIRALIEGQTEWPDCGCESRKIPATEEVVSQGNSMGRPGYKSNDGYSTNFPSPSPKPLKRLNLHND